MQLAGTHIVHATPSKVWNMLMDIETLAKLVPGVSHLEKTGDNNFKSTFEIKLGPVSSSFTGNLQNKKASPSKYSKTVRLVMPMLP